MLASPPLSLWLPYELYRRSHLTHHRDERLTDPLDDPESWYFTGEQWNELSRPIKSLFAFQNTFIGRMLIGPALAMIGFLYSELKKIAQGDFKNLGLWLRHIIAVSFVLWWVTVFCELSPWLYIFGMVYPGTALLLVRSFAEHRAADNVHDRTAIVENASFFGLLFLYNNLHSAHHEKPTMAWYDIPAWYKKNRERLIAENHGHVYDGYLDVIRRYLFTSHHEPRHPTDRAPRADGSLPASQNG
jgi:fatty acid desaturase